MNNFSKDKQMANKHMKRGSTSLIIKEMQIKTTMRHHLILIRMATIKKKKTENDRCWQGHGDIRTLMHDLWE